MKSDCYSESAAESRHACFMRRALELAVNGLWSVPPNPAVGAVVVSGDTIVGEGYHLRPGTSHAEVIALEKAGESARGGTIYVNLEPCNHHGRTPPCSEAIIRAGIKRVVIPCVDPSRSVRGRGMARLRDAGVEVIEDVECEAARRLNARHFRAAREERPVMIAKVARTLDGRTALHGPAALDVTGEEAQEYVGRRRSDVDAIMVGSGTLLADDPRLNARTAEGELLPRQPIRVIADARLRTPPDARLLSEPGGEVLLLVGEERMEGPDAEALRATGARLLPVPIRAEEGLDISTMLTALAAEGIDSIMVEGGGMLLYSLAAEDLIDFWQIWIAGKIIGAGRGVVFSELGKPIRLGPLHAMEVGGDLLVSAFPAES